MFLGIGFFPHRVLLHGGFLALALWAYVLTKELPPMGATPPPPQQRHSFCCGSPSLPFYFSRNQACYCTIKHHSPSTQGFLVSLSLSKNGDGAPAISKLYWKLLLWCRKWWSKYTYFPLLLMKHSFISLSTQTSGSKASFSFSWQQSPV